MVIFWVPALIFIRVPFLCLASLPWLREGCAPSRSLDRLPFLLPMQFPAAIRFIVECKAWEENVLAPRSAVLHCPASVVLLHSIVHAITSSTGFFHAEKWLFSIRCFPCPKSKSAHSQLWISILNKASGFQAIIVDSRKQKRKKKESNTTRSLLLPAAYRPSTLHKEEKYCLVSHPRTSPLLGAINKLVIFDSKQGWITASGGASGEPHASMMCSSNSANVKGSSHWTSIDVQTSQGSELWTSFNWRVYSFRFRLRSESQVWGPELLLTHTWSQSFKMSIST